MTVEDMITTAEAVELTGLHRTHLARLARSGWAGAKKIGRDWFYNRRAVLDSPQMAHRAALEEAARMTGGPVTSLEEACGEVES